MYSNTLRSTLMPIALLTLVLHGQASAQAPSCEDANPVEFPASSFELDYTQAGKYWFKFDGSTCDQVVRAMVSESTSNKLQTFFSCGSDWDLTAFFSASNPTSFVLPAGETMYLSIESQSGAAFDTITFTEDYLLPPSNDEADDAISIGSGEALFSPAFTAYPDCATASVTEKSLCELPMPQDVWFSYTNDEPGAMILELDWKSTHESAVVIHDSAAGYPCGLSSWGQPGQVSNLVLPGATRLIRVVQSQEAENGSITVHAKVEPYNPWNDLGNGLAGSGGVPVCTADGPLTEGTAVAVDLTNAAPSSVCALVVGFSSVGLPFNGGVLVPNPEFLFLLPTDSQGDAGFTADWPSGLTGTVFLQWWIVDASGPFGVTASNAVSGRTPVQ